MEKKDKEKKPRKVKSIKKVKDEVLNEEMVNNKKNKKDKKKGKKGWKVFKICLFIFIALAIVCAGVVLGVITGIIDKTDSISPEELKNLEETSHVYDMNGNEIGSFSGEINRVLVKYSDLPQSLIDSVVAIEDERFFTHKGVDMKRTLAAIVTYVLNGGDSTFGGSTITQQLIKNISEDKDKTWVRKIREWYRAYNIETVLEKDEIIISYLNTIYLGDGCYGVQAASKNYFGKSVNDLTIAESAILGAIIQSPEATNPYRSEEARERLLTRQKVVLDKMLSLGKITKEQYDEAYATEIAFKKAENDETDVVQSYFVDAVFEAVVKDLMEEKDTNKATAEMLLYTGGYKINTTMDPTVQAAIDEAYNNPNLFYTDEQGYFMQSSMVVLDHNTGNIVGLIGGAGEKTGNRSLNRATQTTRQSGSCMKPIAAYGPAFEKGILSPGSGLDDSLAGISQNIKEWYGYYNGYVTVRNAVAQSMNLPAHRAILNAGVDYAYNFAKNIGLNSLVETDKTASLALGGLTYGVSVLEMANAYATFANKGVYIEPKIYTTVTDSAGNIVLDNTESTARVAMKESTAFMITSCLESVVIGGTASGHVGLGGKGISVAGKTGNTNDDLDQWFCGYTPYYTIACWNGYDKNERAIGWRKIGSYPYTSVYLFNQVMNKICEGKPGATFGNRPNTVTSAELCKVSGLVATDACKKDPRGSQVGSDYIEVGKIPTETCTIHKMVTVCKKTGKIAGENCSDKEEKSYITRDAVPNVKPRDWDFMLPTETCNTCEKVVEKPKEENNKVDVYNDKKPTTKPNTNTSTNNKPTTNNNNNTTKPNNNTSNNSNTTKPNTNNNTNSNTNTSTDNKQNTNTNNNSNT